MSDVARAIARLLLQAALESQRIGRPHGGDPAKEESASPTDREARNGDGTPEAPGLLTPPVKKTVLLPYSSEHHQRSGTSPDCLEEGHA